MVGKIRYALLAYFILLVSLVVGQDQDYLVSRTGDTTVIEPISVAEIPNRIENTLSKAKKIEERLKPIVSVAEFDSIYEEFVSERDKKINRMKKHEDNYNQMTLDNDINEWTVLKKNLGDYKEIVNNQLTEIENDLFEITLMEATWTATINAAKEGGVPESALTSARDVETRVKTIKKEEVKGKNSAVGKLDQISGLDVSIDDELDKLEKERKKLQGDYFKEDSPPIWRAGDTTASFAKVKSQLLTNKTESLRNLTTFYDTNRRGIYLQLLLFLALWIGLYFLHRVAVKIEANSEHKELEKSEELLSHYALSSLILALFASIWIYESISPIVGQLMQFTYIIIAIALLPRYIGKKLNKILISLLVLFFLNQLQSLFFGRVLFVRLVMFLEIFLAGYILILLVDPKGFISKELKKYKWGFLLKIIPVFFVLLVMSFLGNIFGFVDLALLLNNAVIYSLFNLNILLLAMTVLNRVAIVLLRTPIMQGSNIVKNHIDELEKRFFQLVQIFGILLWFEAVLGSMGILDDILLWLDGFFNEPFKVGSTDIEIGGIFIFILVIVITIFLFRFIKLLLNEEIFPRITLPRGVPGSISMITGYLIAGYGFYIAIEASGGNLSSFGLLAGALGVGIGFGLQGIVANFIAGLVLAFERPIQVGDEIEMPQSMGIVKSIGVRSVTIRTYDGSEVIIPNSDLITKDVINWTLTDRKKRRDINIGVAYGSDPEVVLNLIKKVATEHPSTLKIPAPWALFDGFGDSSLNFRIRIWTTMDTGMTVKSDVTVAIYDALREAGIEIPFPQRDLHIRSIEENVQKELTKKKPTRATRTSKAVKPPPAKDKDDLTKE